MELFHVPVGFGTADIQETDSSPDQPTTEPKKLEMADLIPNLYPNTKKL